MTPRPRIMVVGLGPGDAGLIGIETRRILEQVETRFVRTRRHPSASEVGAARSFDDVYEQAETLDVVYPAIVEALVEAAAGAADGRIVYAVPGSPLVAERTVELLRLDPRIDLEVIPALSFVDLAWDRLGIDPFVAGVRLVDGHRFAGEAAGSTGPLLVSQCDSRQVLSEIKLTIDDGPKVVVLSRLGMPDEAITPLAWADLDREVVPDHLTCLWIPQLADPVAAEIVRFESLVRTLRVACPWDREQTHASLTRHLIEETYEVLEAIDGLTAGDGEAVAYGHLEEELGDLLFQVAFHAVLATEAGQFTLADVARGIHDKLVRRHPHVFGPAASSTSGDPLLDSIASDADAVVANWEHAKKLEKGRASIMDGIPPALPALLASAKVGRKAASVGFDWDDLADVWDKLAEELVELREAVDGGVGAVADELGDVLFTVVNLARHLEVDAEDALRAATTKFRNRFATMEAIAAVSGQYLAGIDAAGWDRLWEQSKRATEPASGERPTR
ncbi:MAG: nucleoside triphosphate pyrophosphohydrolase [Actinomycetota bacterium]|nr:nucleoside triphosphate pyrophosphohydrolase [Actinomycetota bacterium]